MSCLVVSWLQAGHWSHLSDLQVQNIPLFPLIHLPHSFTYLIQLHSYICVSSLSPDLHILWQMFSLLLCILECVDACICAGPACCGYPGASSIRRHNRPEFINVLHFPSSVWLCLPHRSALQCSIPHTLELRERPVARQGMSSGMSLLSQGDRVEGGREQEVNLESLRCTVDFSKDCWSSTGFHHQSFDHYTQLCPWNHISTEVHASGPITTRRNLILELSLFKSISPPLSVAVSCRLSHGLHRCHTRLALLSVHSVCCWGSVCIHSHSQTCCSCMQTDTQTYTHTQAQKHPSGSDILESELL